MHRIPDVSLGLVVHMSPPLASPRKGVWSGLIRHDVWILDYCGWEGMHCSVYPGGEEALTFPRAPGTWHLYAPGVAYRERYDRPELRREDMWLHFRIRRRFGALSGRAFAAVADPEERIAPHVRAMYAFQEFRRPGTELVTHGLLLVVLGEILGAARRGGEGLPEDPWIVRSPEGLAAEGGQGLLGLVDGLVSRRPSSPPSLEELARELHMSVSSLAHRFKAETGSTVIERVRWLRIREARRLLGSPGATVKSVARRLGFKSPAYFSKVFAEVAGIQPVSYLRRHGGG